MKTSEPVVCDCGQGFHLQASSSCLECRVVHLTTQEIRSKITNLETQAVTLRIEAAKLQTVLMYRERLMTNTDVKGRVVLYTKEDFWKNVKGKPQERRAEKGKKKEKRKSLLTRKQINEFV